MEILQDNDDGVFVRSNERYTGCFDRNEIGYIKILILKYRDEH